MSIYDDAPDGSALPSDKNMLETEQSLAHARRYAAARRPAPSSRLFASSAKPPSRITASVEATRAALTAFVADPLTTTRSIASRLGGAVQSAVQQIRPAGEVHDEDAKLRAMPLMHSRATSPLRDTVKPAAATAPSSVTDMRPTISLNPIPTASASEARRALPARASSPQSSDPASGAIFPAPTGTLTSMLLDDDVLEGQHALWYKCPLHGGNRPAFRAGADPLDCCGLSPALDDVLNEEEDEAADALADGDGSGSPRRQNVAPRGGASFSPARRTSEGLPSGGYSPTRIPTGPTRQSSAPPRQQWMEQLQSRTLVRQRSGGGGGAALGGGVAPLGGGGAAGAGGLSNPNRSLLGRLLLGRKLTDLDVTCYSFGSPRVGNPTFARCRFAWDAPPSLEAASMSRPSDAGSTMRAFQTPSG